MAPYIYYDMHAVDNAVVGTYVLVMWDGMGEYRICIHTHTHIHTHTQRERERGQEMYLCNIYIYIYGIMEAKNFLFFFVRSSGGPWQHM